jgi:hypothetical protein
MSFNFRTRQTIVSVDQDIEGGLSRTLHQATQPLTVIQGTLELALLTASTLEQYKYAVGQSLEELQRLTHCFEHLRTLICSPDGSPAVAELCGSLHGQAGPDEAESTGGFTRSPKAPSAKVRVEVLQQKGGVANVWSSGESALAFS